MLTEKDAWITLAGVWAKAEPHDDCEHHCALIENERQTGLCSSITRLALVGHINMEAQLSMGAKLKKFRNDNKISSAFYWLRNAQGARERSLFCSSQAEVM